MSYDKKKIYGELVELKDNAYAPYSNFKVSCILFLKNGDKIVGVNVENSSYNPTICAERSALPQLYAQGFDSEDVELMALYTDSKNVGTPCGTCRQTMSELLKPSQIVEIYNVDGYCKTVTVEELLPYSFSGKDL